jgi:hypothetical protein
MSPDNFASLPNEGYLMQHCFKSSLTKRETGQTGGWNWGCHNWFARALDRETRLGARERDGQDLRGKAEIGKAEKLER